MVDAQTLVQRYALSELRKHGYDIETPSRDVYAYIVAKQMVADNTKTPLFALSKKTDKANVIDGFNAARTEESARATAVWYNDNNPDGAAKGEKFVIIALRE